MPSLGSFPTGTESTDCGFGSQRVFDHQHVSEAGIRSTRVDFSSGAEIVPTNPCLDFWINSQVEEPTSLPIRLDAANQAGLGLGTRCAKPGSSDPQSCASGRNRA
jgi:hypothetical protein